ncbi:hypothetical protein [Xanthomonas arboricola]|uniref:hypothetical protein n=1 Tax=Xanthomonas arboricola TaxID=56448 RepID=UPI003EBD7078
MSVHYINSARFWMPATPGLYRFSCAEIGYRSIDVQVRRNDADVLVASAPGLGTETVKAMHRKLTRAEWEVIDVG